MLEAVRPAEDRNASPGTGPAGPSLERDPIEGAAFSRPHAQRDCLGSALAALAAGLLHAGLLLAASHSGWDERAGAGGIDADAVSIEVSLVSVGELEARERREEAAGGIAGVAAATDATPANTSAPPQAPPPEPTPPTTAALPPDPSPRPDALEIAALVERPIEQPPTPPTRTPTPEADKRRPETVSEPSPTAPAEAAPAAMPPSDSAGTRAVVEQAPSKGAAAASPGEVRRYAESLVAALKKAKPTGAGRSKGTVRVAFAITEEGALSYVRVAASSGNAVLDEAALAALRQVRFPRPPDGMTSRERSYEIPYHFR